MKVSKPTKGQIAKLIASLDDEAFSWIALALLPKAMMHGAKTQIFPDGLGGFKDREKIENLQLKVKAYCGFGGNDGTIATDGKSTD